MCTAATPDTDTAPRADEPCGPPSAASDELAVTTATPAEAAAAEAAAEAAEAAAEAEVPPPAEEPAAETEGPAEEETAAVALPGGEPAAEEEAADEEVVAAGQPAGTAPEVRKLPSTTLSVTLKGDKAQPAMTADLSRRRGVKVKTYSRTIALTITAGTTTTLRELATQGALKILGPRAAEVALRQEGVLHAEDALDEPVKLDTSVVFSPPSTPSTDLVLIVYLDAEIFRDAFVGKVKADKESFESNAKAHSINIQQVEIYEMSGVNKTNFLAGIGASGMDKAPLNCCNTEKIETWLAKYKGKMEKLRADLLDLRRRKQEGKALPPSSAT
ncbi:hypothetical protein EMIHUDRAFT_450525 [Emiliania huxleyi CCMP1516]|uniref:Uncharacterized protein n=2 Tax=Emiliania huxleyi TaxID=2903 RepID=A0A0D3JM44_EMIH1|nr:hypothetical protein EMIHUDRAFT_450525 [Emiliania huxleyi CCMP1516]EOD24579.1 hypothetical protein EMIHUDRAFT_450525 [Emiliania huxleyi CCMP1516]|eukprot:XP_005777008.1 hypothetical protein EMIHUDRAFT_450525 [Emiliania huxleyi CCMP1516]